MPYVEAQSSQILSAAMASVCGPHILPGIPFGEIDQVLTPAYWKQRCAEGEIAGHGYFSRACGTLVEEVGFCILGGFGITLELNTSAFLHLKKHNIFLENENFTTEDIQILLEKPLIVQGRERRYRFPRQRAARLAAALKRLQTVNLDNFSDVEFRDWIVNLPGVGPKTASWITRNWRRSDQVAILDIHILRACWYIGLFDFNIDLPRDYFDLEKQFLDFASALDSRPSILDAVMWDDMRAGGSRLVRPYVPR